MSLLVQNSIVNQVPWIKFPNVHRGRAIIRFIFELVGERAYPYEWLYVSLLTSVPQGLMT
jgi:hypothetical protein